MSDFTRAGPGARRTLRARLRERRRRLAPDEAAEAAEAAAALLADSTEFRQAQRIAAYVAVRGELDPRLILETALAAGKEIFLPQVAAGGTLHFLPWQTRTPLRSNRYGIPEPIAGESSGVPPTILDLVIVPVVGFTRDGIRLGTGGGYYDHSFAFKLAAPGEPPWLAGFAYAFQECSALDAAEWDVPLDLIVTERGIARFNPSLT